MVALVPLFPLNPLVFVFQWFFWFLGSHASYGSFVYGSSFSLGSRGFFPWFWVPHMFLVPLVISIPWVTMVSPVPKDFVSVCPFGSYGSFSSFVFIVPPVPWVPMIPLDPWVLMVFLLFGFHYSSCSWIPMIPPVPWVPVVPLVPCVTLLSSSSRCSPFSLVFLMVSPVFWVSLFLLFLSSHVLCHGAPINQGSIY